MLVKCDQPWICASVDGLVLKNDSTMKLVEVKCPSKGEKTVIVDYINEKCNQNYLCFEDNRVKLKETHQY